MRRTIIRGSARSTLMYDAPMPTMTSKRSAPKKRSTTKRRPITAEDLLKLQIVSSPRLSPDGSLVVFVKKHIIADKNEYVTNLWIVASDGSSDPRQFTSGGKDSQPHWSPDGSRIAFVSGRERTRMQICVMNAQGGEAVPLTTFPEGTIGQIRWSLDGAMIGASFRDVHVDWTEKAKAERKEKGLSDPPRVIDDWWYRLDGDGYFIAQRHHLYLINAQTGKHRKVYDQDVMGHFSFDFAPDSKRLVIATNRDRKAMIRPWKDELLILDVASGKTKQVPNLPEGPKAEVQWSPDGKCLAYAGRIGKDGLYDTNNLELFVCDPVRGHARSLTGKEDYCLLAAAISDSSELSFAPHFRFMPDSRRIMMQIGWQGESHLASVGVAGGRIQFHTHGARMHALGNMSADGNILTFTMGTATQMDEVYVSRVKPSWVGPLTDFNGPLLKELDISKPQVAWVKTADGTRCQVWMMKPAGFKRSRKYPAVLEIHGGPHAQYGLGFFHEFQTLAANGYVVFFANPRGSKGYGREHTTAIRGSWGGADWVDIQAVMQRMKAQPFVNPKKMGVMGGSYGGYMTNWVIGHTREFAGAITDRCVSNLVSMGGNSDYVDEPDQYWEGNSWDRPETRWAQSPIKYLGNARTPTLIIHSEGDLRCNVEQSEQVFSALKLLNVPTRFVRYPASTSHGMSRGGPPDLRIHRLNQILDWWRKYLK